MIATTTMNLEQMKTFFIGSLFLLSIITVLLMWTGGLLIEYKKRRPE
jgi:hypothetical protein